MGTRFLAINFGGLGDEVLFLPTLDSIRAVHSDWHIALLTEPRSQAIAQLTDLIDESLTFDIKKQPLTLIDRFKLIELLRQYKPDIILSSGSTPLVSLLLYLSGAPTRIGYGTSQLGNILLTNPVRLNKQQYAGWMYHDLVTGLGINRQPGPPKIVLNEAALLKAKDLFSPPDNNAISPATQEKIVLLHPGTSRLAIKKGIIKTWPVSNWIALITALLAGGHRVALCGGPDDQEIINQIVSLLPSLNHNQNSNNAIDKAAKTYSKFLNLNGKTKNVGELAALMQLSDLVICVDSAPMHIAAALDRPLVALFGPTEPEHLLLPAPERRILQGQVINLIDAPDKSGVQIPTDMVYQAAEDLLSLTLDRHSFR